ncbi:MAG TPA: hypothetical protein VN493_28495 [Thermoanaerobaculia bacterium]|nr:hypothetical protein [Thermoanaerobaculia bacterium]
MKIPHAERAEVSIHKLRAYCLNPQHDEGKHKARVFASALGLTAADAESLRDLLLDAVRTHDAQLGFRDDYGQRYIVDFQVVRSVKRAMVRSGWILEHASEVPRLTTCYVLD